MCLVQRDQIVSSNVITGKENNYGNDMYHE